MITSISIKNFKSYKNAELVFAPLTLFIGANASGKSNALEAIRLLSWLAKGSRLDDIERNIQGADSLVRGLASNLFRYGNQQAEIGCHISDAPEGWSWLSLGIGLIEEHLIIVDEQVRNVATTPFPLYQVDDTPNAHTDEVRVMYNNFKRGRNKPHIPCSNRQAIFYQLETPGRFSKNHERSQELIPDVAKQFRQALRNIVFLDPKPSLMRDYSYAKDDEIKEDGSNLSGVLYSIWSKSETLGNKTYRDQLLDFVRSLPEQDIADIEFIETDRNDVMVRLVESFGGEQRRVDAPLLSDGTLRVLAVAAALLTAPEGTLVIVEEIDNGIHPSRADNLIRNIIDIAELRDLRILLTSHNPALLDVLPDACLGAVLCCYRDPKNGDSRIAQLKELERYPEVVARGPLGELMTQGILDRFLKDRSTLEERKKDALEWMKTLEAETSG